MRVTSKGQVTIPQHIRERLGLLPNTEVEFSIEKGRGVLRPKKGPMSRAKAMVAHMRRQGASKLRMNSKELLALLRDEPDEISVR